MAPNLASSSSAKIGRLGPKIAVFPHISGQAQLLEKGSGTLKLHPKGSPHAKLGENRKKKFWGQPPKFIPLFGAPYLRNGGRYLHALFAIR